MSKQSLNHTLKLVPDSQRELAQYEIEALIRQEQLSLLKRLLKNKRDVVTPSRGFIEAVPISAIESEIKRLEAQG